MRSNNSLRRNGKYRRSMRQILGFNFYDVFVFLFCIVFALVCVYPMWYVLVASVTPYEEYIKGGLMLWPTGGVDLQYYKAIFSTKSFTNSMWISVSKTVIATVLSVLVTASMAYGVSKVHVKGMKVINALVVFNLFFTGGLNSGIGVKGDFDDAYSDFGAGKIASADFGFGYPGQFRDFYKTAWAAANDGAQMSDLTLGTSLTSDGNYGKTYTTGTWIGAHYFIPTTCENPDRVLDLVEYLASTEGQDLLHNTTNYEFRNDQGSDFWQPINKAYGYDDNRCKYVWFSYLLSGTEYEVNFADNDWWTAVSHPIDNSNEWATKEDAALVDYAKGIVSGFVDEAVEYLPAYYNLISLPSEAADIRTKLQDISNQYLTQMIGGQMDVETAWPNYVAEYEAAGAAELETMVNEAIATARAAA